VRFLGFRHHPVDESDLSAFIDAALSEAKRASVEAHLRSCEGCARKLEELKQLVTELHSLPEAKAPRSFALSPELAAVSQREEKMASEGRRTTARRAYVGLSGATAAAALLLVAAFGMDFFVVSNGGQPASQPSAMSSGGPVSLPQAAAALPPTTIPGYYANQPGAENQNSGQAVVPPVPPSGTAVPGEVIAPPATPNALSAALPTVSPPGVASPVPSLGEASAQVPQAQPAEKSASHAWLWALEGAAGGLFIGFGISAFWMRRRWIRINRDS